MEYTYSSLLSSNEYNKTFPRRAASFISQWRTAFLVSVAIMVMLLHLLGSDAGHASDAPATISCQKRESSYYSSAKSADLPAFDESDWSVPATSAAVDTSNTSVHWSKVTHLQICTHPDASSSYLLALLNNHREYCRKAGIEYLLKTGEAKPGRRGGVWSKIYALIDKLEEELAKPERDRAEWIFMADVDTLFVDPEVRVEAVLPPKGVTAPFLLASQDWNGFNAGSLFFRVEHRSLEFAKNVFGFWSWPLDPRLWWAEQSAMKILFKQGNLLERGQVVYMPREFFNSYSAARALDGSVQDSTAAVVHFPSPGNKREILFPLLHKMVLGKAPRLSLGEVQHRNDNLRLAAGAFWERYSQGERPQPCTDRRTC